MAKAIAIKLLAAAAIFAALWFGVAPWSWVIAGVVLLATLALIGHAVFNVNSSVWARTLWRSPHGVDAVALTFDDGPDERFTRRVLDILREKKVQGAFFVVGSRAQKHPELLRRMHAEGHIIGNHSFSHAWNINFGLHRRLWRELSACNDIVASIAGTPRFYRPPHGFKNPALGEVLERTGMIAVGWQLRAFDAVRQDAAAIARRMVEGARPGGVLLLHDGGGLQGTDDRGATLEALPVIIDGLRARGLTIARLDELLEVEPYQSKTEVLAVA